MSTPVLESNPGVPEAGRRGTAWTLSPVLQRFEQNPFRVLQIPSNTNSEETALLSERALTLARAGFWTGTDALLPMLPPPDSYQVQRAAHFLEEPLARLVEQLLWFDLERDPDSGALEAALGDRSGDRMREFLGSEIAAPELPDPDDLDEDEPVASGQERDALAAVASAINRANLAIVVASALQQGVFVAAGTGRANAAGLLGPGTSKGTWRDSGGGGRLRGDSVHDILGGGAGSTGATSSMFAADLWAAALADWTSILAHPWFQIYAVACLDALDDPMLEPEDAQVVLENLPGQLADLYVLEARFFLNARRYGDTSALLTALGAVEMETRLLNHAIRPLHTVFEAEIQGINRQLDSLLDDAPAAPGGESGDVAEYKRLERYNLAIIESHVKRLQALKQRWDRIDPNAVLGLSNFLDDAVEQTFLRVRREPLPVEKEPALYDTLKNLATAESLTGRIAAGKTQMEESRQWRSCHYCKDHNPNVDSSVVLRGKKVTSVEKRGNTTITHYLLSNRYVPRCNRCSRLHDFVAAAANRGGWAMLLLVVPLFLILLWPMLRWIGDGFSSSDSRLGGIIAMGEFVFWVVVVAILYAQGSKLLKKILFPLTTPEGHVLYGSYAGSEGERELRAEKFDITPDFSSRAVAKLEAEQAAKGGKKA